MEKALILLGFLCCFYTGMGVAQTVDYPNGIAARGIFPNYQWSLKESKSLEIVDFTSGLEFEYYRYLTKHCNISIPLRLSNSYLPINENNETYKAGNLGIDVLLNFKLIKKGWFRPHLFAGGGMVVEDMKTFSANIPMGLGLNFKIGRNSFISTTAVYKLDFKELRSYLQIGAGLRFNIIPKDKNKEIVAEEELYKDTDMDGVLDNEDLCPELAGLKELSGCPDADKDGVTDASDHCPNIAGSRILNGCPDNDNDGLIDIEDDCPKLAGPVSNHGCPYNVEGNNTMSTSAFIQKNNNTPIPESTPDVETDKDFIRSSDVENTRETVQIAFKETATPEVKEAASEKENAPEKNLHQTKIITIDTDGDGIADADDKCPNLKGSVQAFGCPELTKSDKEILAEAIETVEFETGSAIIIKESYPILEQVAEVLLRNKAYQLKLSGHTDSTGSEKDNEILSKRRALACFNFLLTKRIPRSRMSYTGFGESQPIEDNNSAAGRERNRRVVFEVFIP